VTHLIDKSEIVIQHKAFVNSVVFSPDGKQVMTGSDDGTAKVTSLID
jgi:WD40 repeat protein